MKLRIGLGFLAVALVVLAAGCAAGGDTKKEAVEDEGTAIIMCPVSGEVVDPATAPSAEHNGKTYYFCCEKCPVKFKADPDKYAEE